MILRQKFICEKCKRVTRNKFQVNGKHYCYKCSKDITKIGLEFLKQKKILLNKEINNTRKKIKAIENNIKIGCVHENGVRKIIYNSFEYHECIDCDKFIDIKHVNKYKIDIVEVINKKVNEEDR